MSIPAWADALSVKRGKAFVTGQLFSVPFDRPILPKSPQERASISNAYERYPVETLEDAFAEGISTGHPRMPEFQVDPARPEISSIF